jgi:virginiamycin B lyase
MRRLAPILAVLALGAPLPAAAAADHGPPPRSLISHLRQGTEVQAMAVGPENYLWFGGINTGESPSNVVGRISPAGAVEEHALTNSAGALGIGGITRGPEGDMWFTEPAANRIERITPTGHPEGFTVPTPGSRPTGIIGAPGGFLWVTMEGTGKVGKVDPLGSVVETTLEPGARPTAIALGPDSALWAVERETATLARVALQGGSATYPLPTSGAIFAGAINTDVVTGPDGNLWLSQEGSGPFVAEVIPTATQPEYVRREVPTEEEEEEEEGTTLISGGPHGDIWYATEAGAIGSISPDGAKVGDPACTLDRCTPLAALAEGPEGELWFAAGETIGRYRPPKLFLVKAGPVKLREGKLKLPLECRGGAAGERCKGTIEAVRGKTPIVRGNFSIPTLTKHKVTLHFVGQAGRRAADRRHPPSHYVARFSGKQVPIYEAKG